jgi:hypothetical protein
VNLRMQRAKLQILAHGKQLQPRGNVCNVFKAGAGIRRSRSVLLRVWACDTYTATKASWTITSITKQVHVIENHTLERALLPGVRKASGRL